MMKTDVLMGDLAAEKLKGHNLAKENARLRALLSLSVEFLQKVIDGVPVSQLPPPLDHVVHPRKAG